MKSVMTASLRQSSVPELNIPRSSFNLSHGHKTTFDSQYLIPHYLQEVIPGDTHSMTCKHMVRMSTPLYPLMDNLFLDQFYFFVPMRLVWTNFKKMMGEQANPGDSVDYTIPQVTGPVAGHAEGSLYDYLGVPPGVANLGHSNIPARMYQLIYNEWFRDQNLQNSVTVDVDDGPDLDTDYVLRKRGKRFDYFTSCLPWTQKTGATEVLMPLGTSAPITGLAIANGATAAASGTVKETDGTGNITYANYFDSASDNIVLEEDPSNTLFPNVRADLSNASAATINQFRQAQAIQVLYERDARGGTRYPEILYSHFGITNAGGDARLQRPEYLGGGSNPININPVANTSNTDTGDLAAIGYSYSDNVGFQKSFTEHGFIMGLINVRGDITYQQGLQRHWLRNDKLDYYWPSLSQIGEMAVTKVELYAQDPATDTGATGTPDNDRVWGYLPAYEDLRMQLSRISGAFRSGAATPLDAWHLSPEETSLPSLGNTWIQDATPVSRVVATPAEPEFIGDFWFQQYSARPMPMFGIPASLGRF